MTTPHSTDAEIARAVAALRAGQAIGLPTETVYGLAADAGNPEAVARIFALKGRPPEHPLIVHIAGIGQLPRFARAVPEAARRLAEAFWPGPLTLILPKRPEVLEAVTGGQDSVGLRAPAHPVAQAVLRAFGGGLAAPSANRFGRLSPTRAEHVRAEFGEAVPIVLDGGPCAVGIESTIVDFTGARPRILRPGRIGAAEVEAVAGPLADADAAPVPRAPGTLEAHYAPRTPLMLCPRTRLGSHPGTVVLAIGRLPEGLDGLALAEEPKAYARDLYAALRELDARGAALIEAETPPDTPEWLAVRDRLTRAAAALP